MPVTGKRRAPRDAAGRPACRSSGRGGCEAVVVELEDVVGGGDHSPLAANGGSTAALEAFDRAVELDLAEHRLDGDLALAVELAALGRREDATHGVVEAAGPARPCALAQTAVGRDEHRDAFAGDLFDLALMPVASVGQHDPGITQLDRAQLALGGTDH